MKRLALLLAAMGILSVGAMAEEPTLKVTNIGQELEIENTSGGENIGEATYLTTSVGLSYGDWTFGVAGTKFWKADTSSIKSYDGRLQLDAWKKVSPDLSLGLRYRGYDSEDRYYVRYNYTKDWFWSSGDVWYTADNEGDAPDTFNFEIYPLGFKYGAFKAGWFVAYTDYVGNGLGANGLESKIEHQVRLYANLYKTEKLSLDAEARINLDYSEDHKDNQDYVTFDDFGKNRVYLGATYSVNENLDVYAKYGYEIRDKKMDEAGTKVESGEYFGDFIVGWNYKF